MISFSEFNLNNQICSSLPASGDLTDSRSKSPLGSGQFEQEWIWYQEVLQSTNVTNKTAWLDIRGNHG